jgi:hypothetical protein
MTARAAITTTAAALRTAVEENSYGESERLLRLYCRQVEAILRAEPAAPENARLAADSSVLFQWMRRTVLAALARDADQLSRIPPRNAYAPASQPQSWLVDG